MDRNSHLASLVAPIVNWATKTSSPVSLPRRLLERALGIHAEAVLPQYVPAKETLVARSVKEPLVPNLEAPAYKSKRKVLIYATCSGNWNNPAVGLAARKVLSHNGVEVKVAYPGCCGMPQLEQGNLSAVVVQAKHVASNLKKWIDDGWAIVATVPSCVLMMKQEWSTLLPEDQDVKHLAASTKDISEYVMDIAKKEGLTPGLQPVEAGVMLHNACHSRAQNIGFKAEEMLALIPSLSVSVIENCSGHGGSFGVKKQNFLTALKVGERAVKKAVQHLQDHSVITTQDAPPLVDEEEQVAKKLSRHFLSSECPLAADHIKQGLPNDAAQLVGTPKHPIELLALSYGL